LNRQYAAQNVTGQGKTDMPSPTLSKAGKQPVTLASEVTNFSPSMNKTSRGKKSAKIAPATTTTKTEKPSIFSQLGKAIKSIKNSLLQPYLNGWFMKFRP
jgi:hypothetical protein